LTPWSLVDSTNLQKSAVIHLQDDMVPQAPRNRCDLFFAN